MELVTRREVCKQFIGRLARNLQLSASHHSSDEPIPRKLMSTGKYLPTRLTVDAHVASTLTDAAYSGRLAVDEVGAARARRQSRAWDAAVLGIGHACLSPCVKVRTMRSLKLMVSPAMGWHSSATADSSSRPVMLARTSPVVRAASRRASTAGASAPVK
jgi:hypothetical protein